MTPEQIIAVIAGLLAGTPNANFDQLRAGGFEDRYPVTIEACESLPGPLEIEGQTVICGTVSLPEDYSKPDGNRVPLEFAVIKSLSQSPAADPVVYLHGGPGGGTLEALAAVGDRIFPKHRVTRDIVTFDQRAAALSSRTVNCYEEMAKNIVELAKLPPGTQQLPGALLSKVIGPCMDEIKSGSADLAAYNSANNARDVRALMSALGYPTYNMYGISYGTRLALEVLRTAPEGVRSAVIDGVAPTTVYLYDDLLGPFADALDALVDQCAADEACNTSYPDLRSTINAAFTRLMEAPIPAARDRAEINPMALFQLALISRNSPAERRPITAWLPRIFKELAEGKSEAFDAVSSMTPPVPTKSVGIPKGLTEDERTLVMLALDYAQAMGNLNSGVATAINRLKTDLGEARQTTSVAEAFDARATQAIIALGDPAAITAMIQDYALLQTMTPGRQPLVDWVSKHFSGADGDALLELVSIMTEADIARVFDTATSEATKYQQLMRGAINQAIYACQEDVPYNNLDGFKARIEELAKIYPIVALFGADTSFYAKCQYFDQHPREGFHDPIVSDVPVLSLNGLMDTQTSWRWGAVAVETLSNGRNYVIPQAGHGTLIFQQCAADISVAFINDPAAVLDTSCIDRIAVKFAMPDDPLPR